MINSIPRWVFVNNSRSRAPRRVRRIRMLRKQRLLGQALDYDGMIEDFTAEARMIDGKIPVLNVLSNWYEGWAEAGKSWLAKNAPQSETLVLGNHMMFFEFPNEFNAALDKFFAKIQ